MTKIQKPRSLRHISLFRLHDDVDEATCQKAISLQRGLEDVVPGMLEWHIELSLNDSKGKVVVQNGLFEDREALEAYRACAQHKEVVTFMAAISDWWVGDYFEESS